MRKFFNSLERLERARASDRLRKQKKSKLARAAVLQDCAGDIARLDELDKLSAKLALAKVDYTLTKEQIEELIGDD